MINEIKRLIEQQPTENISIVVEFGDVFFEHQETKAYYPASTVKVPNAMINMMKHRKELHDLSIPVKGRVPGCGVLHTMKDVHSISLYDAIVLSIIMSDNTAANMLIDHIGIEGINEGYENLGLSHTYLRGLYYDFENTNRRMSTTTASDLYHCLKLLDDDSEVLPSEVKTGLLEIMKKQQINDRAGAVFIPSGDDGSWVASKTGSVDNLEHEFGIISHGGKELVFAVCSDGWPSNMVGKRFLNELGEIFYRHMEDE